MAHDAKDDIHQVEHSLDEKQVSTQTKVASGDEAFQQAMIKEPPKLISSIPLVLYVFVAFCCSTANGYDGSLFGTLLSNQDFRDFFTVKNSGIWTGIVTAMYQIGSVVAIPFVGPAIDTWGRRCGMCIGAVIIIVGVIIQLTCITNANVGQFMCGRFFLGFGVAIMSAGGPTYVVEIAHPAYRGIIGGRYNVMWPVGALVASGAARGGLNHEGNTSWMIPVGLQLMFPCIVAFGAFILPESPRWLYTRGKTDRAIAILTKYNGAGNPDSEWVKLQLSEYEQSLEMDGADKRWWDYRALFRDRGSIYRILCNCFVSLFGQWAGNSIVSYYLSAFLDTAGIKGETTQMNVQLGMSAVQIVFAAAGACIVDKVGRRPMLITVNAVCSLCWIGIIVPSSIANITDTESDAQIAAVPPSVSKAVLGWVYIFQMCYSFGWTPMQALYPVEVLSFEMRGKGMGFSSLFTQIGLLATQFGVPVSLDRIHWRTYIVFSCWCMVQATLFYFFIPETKGRTLEELDHIFHSPNPVKTSIAKKKLEVDRNANIINIEEQDNRRDSSAV